MTKASEIDAEFNDRVLLRGGLRLYLAADAVNLISRCRDAGVRVLGVDAFLDRLDGLRPSLENSIDFSSQRHIELLENSWEHAERLVREREASPFLFEVVMD
jgi:hypothetical protein